MHEHVFILAVDDHREREIEEDRANPHGLTALAFYFQSLWESCFPFPRFPCFVVIHLRIEVCQMGMGQCLLHLFFMLYTTLHLISKSYIYPFNVFPGSHLLPFPTSLIVYGAEELHVL